MAKIKEKKKEKKTFKGKWVCDDDTSGVLVRIVSNGARAEVDIDAHIAKVKKEKK